MANFNDGSQSATQFNFVFPQYLTVDVANEYFYQRLNSEVWFQATVQDQNAALIQSTRAIDNLSYLGVKYDRNQKLEFPRWQPDALSPLGQTAFGFGPFSFPNPNPPSNNSVLPPEIPQAVLVACCENAIVLLDGFDFEIELQGLNTQTSQYATIRETYDRNLSVPQLRSGIASGVAWNYLKPWFADANTFSLHRVS